MGVDAVMVAYVPNTLGDGDIRKLARGVCASFGPDKFFIRRPSVDYPNGQRAIERVRSPYYELVTLPGEAVLKVNLSGRYYGPDYERGDLAFYVVLAEWLECRLKYQCRIFYGGDSSAHLDLFDSAARSKLLDHLASEHGRDYFRRVPYDSNMPVPECEFCEAPMSANRYSGATVGFACLSCDLHLLRTPGQPDRMSERFWPDDPRATPYMPKSAEELLAEAAAAADVDRDT